jgi:hypothetical protein
MTYLLQAALVALTVVTLANGARADLPRPDQEACAGKQAGAACQYQGKSGTCAARTCMRASPTGPTSYACVLCETTALDGGASGDGGSSNNDSGSCAMSAGSRAAGPWLLGALFAGLTLLWRRRRA